MRTFRLFAALVLALGAFVVLAAPAFATVTLSTSGSTVHIGSATGSNDATIAFKAEDPNYGGNDRLTIQNVGGSPYGIEIAAGDSGGCSYDPDNPDVRVSCPPSFGSIQASYGGGNDTFRLYQVCVPSTTVDFGEGTNRFTGEDCAGTTTRVTGGSGQDTFGSSEAADTYLGGGGDDDLQGYGGDDELHGGEGNERVDGGEGNDRLYGDGGVDEIAGRAGNDIEDGGPGDDRMGFSPAFCCTEDVDTGADDVRGGEGYDRLTLEDHPGGMGISLDDQANDGSSGEGDNIHSDLEDIYGTRGNDVFVGTPGRDDFNGNSGNDEVRGAGGDDLLYGSSGDDRMFGDGGNDKVQGAGDADSVDGGAGRDQLYGDIASCSLFCNFDSDVVLARDGEADTVDCGGGADQAQVDGLDIVAFCTVVDRQSTAGGGGPGGGAGGGGADGGGASSLALVVAKSIKLNALLKRGLPVRLTCAGACRVVAELRYKGKKLGAGSKTLRAAGTARLAVRVARKTRARVRRLRGKKLSLRLRITSGGTTTTLTRKVKLNR